MASSRSHLPGLWTPILAAAGLSTVAVLLSAYSASHDPGSALAPAGVIAAVLAVGTAVPSRWRWGALIGILILASIDALPGPDLTTRTVALGLDEQDAVVIGLMLVLAVDVALHGLWRFFATPLGRLLLLASLVNLAWWLYTLLRTSTVEGIVLTHAISFVWGFLFNITLVPLLAASLQRRDTRTAVLVAVGVVSLVPASFFFVGSLTHSNFNAVLHATTTRTVGGLTRLFTPVHDLFLVVFPLSGAAALLLPAGRRHRLAVLVALVNLLAIASGQTRAQYLGTAVGVVVASLVCLRASSARRAARRATTAFVVLAALVVLVLTVLPNAGPSRSIRSLGSRIGSISGTVSSSNTSTSTVAVRAGEITLLRQRLGSHWLVGLGFLDPRDDYDANLPFGSIRNTDVGISSPILTMGVIGTVLYYLPLLIVTLRLLWQCRREPDGSTWMRYGAAAGLIGILVSSTTLTTMFSDTGVVAVTALIGMGAAAALEPASSRQPQQRLVSSPPRVSSAAPSVRRQFRTS